MVRSRSSYVSSPSSHEPRHRLPVRPLVGAHAALVFGPEQESSSRQIATQAPFGTGTTPKLEIELLAVHPHGRRHFSVIRASVAEGITPAFSRSSAGTDDVVAAPVADISTRNWWALPVAKCAAEGHHGHGAPLDAPVVRRPLVHIWARSPTATDRSPHPVRRPCRSCTMRTRRRARCRASRTSRSLVSATPTPG